MLIHTSEGLLCLAACALVSSLGMVGVIWFVQIVHYPLMACVGQPESALYARTNQRLTTWVVGPLMLLEAGATVLLSFQPLPDAVQTAFWWGTGLLLVNWLVTACVSVPLHGVLANGFSANHHRRLVLTNWLRTFAWTLRGGLALWVAWGIVFACARAGITAT